MENQNKTFLNYNLPQIAFAQSKIKNTSLEWGRGCGKSTVIGIRLKDFLYNLPRAKIAIPGETYKQLLTQTLPSTIQGLEMIGIKKDLHYFVGRRPPDKWRWVEAYQPPLTYDSSIVFCNGFTAQLISLETDSGGRGINFDGAIGDESGSMDKEKLSNNVLGSNRGNEDKFKKHWLHHSTLFVGTTPRTVKGRWFSDLELLAKKTPQSHLHIKATSFMNADNLGQSYFTNMLNSMTPEQYNAEILCIRPGKIEHGFYPNFYENKHTYDASNTNYLFGLEGDVDALSRNTCRMDSDMREDLPIEIACDWGVTINTMVCGQDAVLGNEYRFINALHVLSPMTLHDLANKFCDYYEPRVNKSIVFHYDHTAIAKSASSGVTFADSMSKALRDRGWSVTMRYHGQAPSHNAKFLFWELAHLEARDCKLPSFRYNKNNCSFLIISTQQAAAIDGKNGIEKDKRPERRQGQRQEEATHYSDAMDTLAYFKFKHRLGSVGFVF